MIPDCSRDADATGRTLGLKSRRHIDCITVQVSAIGNRIANVDPDTKADGSIRRLFAIMDRTCCCTFTAQRTAPSMLSNTISSESPPV